MLSLALSLALLGEPPATGPATAPAPAAVAAPAIKPAVLPFTVQFDLPSKITGRTYRIYVALPPAPPPKAGYPVLYVLDGDMAFPTAGGRAVLGALNGGKAALVVGIAYPNTLASMVLRNRDLTPSQPSP